MLLNRVSLQGFLAHRGSESGGKMAPIEVDLRASNLWLMHGPNGSGKSAVFDAITFALFDEARGSRFGQLVNDQSQSAHVEVELEVGGARFLVKRHLKLNRARDAHTLTGEVWRWNEAAGRWEVEAGVGNKVKEWAARTLQISYANFVSAVVLRQGEADRFLLAKPPERKDRLMELLDLDIYKRLGSAANARRTAYANLAKDKQKRLDACPAVSEEELAFARTAAEDAARVAEETRVAHERAQRLHEAATLAASLRAQIAEKERLREEDDAILRDESAIEEAARESQTLAAALPLLRAVAGARGQLAAAQQNHACAERTLHAAQADAERLTAPVAAAQEEYAASQAASEAARQALAAARATAEGAARDAATLATLEVLERQITAAREQLVPHETILRAAPVIEARRVRLAELRAAEAKVRAVWDARAKAYASNDAYMKAERQHLDAIGDADAKARAAFAAQAALEQAAAHAEELERQKIEVAAELRFQSDLSARRQTLDKAALCPTCGTPLDEAAVAPRLAEERARLASAIGALQERAATLASDYKRALAAKKQCETAFQKANRAAQTANEALAGALASLGAAQQLAAVRRAELEERRREAGAFADTSEDALAAQMQALNAEGLDADLARLADARRVQLESEATTRACGVQLQGLPAWDAARRAHIRESAQAGAASVARAEDAVETARVAEVAAGEAAVAAWRASEAAQSAAQVAAGLLEGAIQSECAALEAFERESARLPPVWAAHPAAREDGALHELEARAQSLRDMGERLAHLNQARTRMAELTGTLSALLAQLRELPADTPESVADAGEALAGAVHRSAHAREAANEAAWRLSDLETARRAFETARAQRDDAATQAARYGDLAGAFGRDGLQAKIVQDAQHSLTRLANGILGRLSNGEWQIDLRGETENELEIIARDEARGGVERTFDCLSGGERFRVAISVAIAIGQMACGGAPMNTLVIDEGFGALDETNRALMVDNLRHLSEHELRGGRIIVVSHQDDVCDAFGHRLRLSRDAGGYARVETVRE